MHSFVRTVPLSTNGNKHYTILFEYMDNSGNYVKFIPQFVVIGENNYVEFNANGYGSMYMRVTVDQNTPISNPYLSPNCSTCTPFIP